MEMTLSRKVLNVAGILDYIAGGLTLLLSFVIIGAGAFAMKDPELAMDLPADLGAQAVLIVGIAMMGAGSNTEKPPRTNTSETNWMRETGDTQRAMYFVDNNCGDYKVLRNEEGDQFRVYSTGEPGKYRDKNNRVFYDD